MSDWLTIKELNETITNLYIPSNFFPNSTYESFEELRPTLLKALEQRGIDGAKADGFVGMAWLTVYEILDSHQNPEYKKNVRRVLSSVVEWLELLVSKIEGVSLVESEPQVNQPATETVPKEVEEVPSTTHSTTPPAPESRGHTPKFCWRTSSWFCERCGASSGSWMYGCVLEEPTGGASPSRGKR